MKEDAQFQEQYARLRNEIALACNAQKYEDIVVIADNQGETPSIRKWYVFEILCGLGAMEALQHFIQRVPKAGDWIDDGLVLAAANAHPQLVRFFVSIGADVNCYASEAMCFIVEQIGYGQHCEIMKERLSNLYECAKLLRDAGAKFPDTKIYSQRPSLQERIESIIEDIKNAD